MDYPRRPIKPRLTVEGQEFTNARLLLGLKQSQVAADLEVHPGRIAEAEIGQKRTPDDLRRLLKSYYDMKIQQRNSRR